MQRLKLLLGKFPVTEVVRAHGAVRMVINISGFKITCHSLPESVDVRNGDILTLYTEVATRAQPKQSSV